MYQRHCKVCGEVFNAPHPNCSICSADCRKTIQKNHNKATYASRNVPRKCTICGGMLTDKRQKYCLDCLLKQFKEKPTTPIRNLLYARKFYSTEAMRTEIKKRGI